MTEYMDIVNELDQVVGRDTRELIHRRHDIHRGVHILVINTRGELLLQQRALTVDYYPGYWDASAGGQVAAGETYEQAAARELAEELGCQHGPLQLIGTYDAFSPRQREKRAVFTHDCDGPFVPAEVIAQLRFLTPAEIRSSVQRDSVTEGFRRSFGMWLAAGHAER
jgi:8-oxo-dGTP pyrophosphatase MutT (NUDIX family)